MLEHIAVDNSAVPAGRMLGSSLNTKGGPSQPCTLQPPPAASISCPPVRRGQHPSAPHQSRRRIRHPAHRNRPPDCHPGCLQAGKEGQFRGVRASDVWRRACGTGRREGEGAPCTGSLTAAQPSSPAPAWLPRTFRDSVGVPVGLLAVAEGHVGSGRHGSGGRVGWEGQRGGGRRCLGRAGASSAWPSGCRLRCCWLLGKSWLSHRGLLLLLLLHVGQAGSLLRERCRRRDGPCCCCRRSCRRHCCKRRSCCRRSVCCHGPPCRRAGVARRQARKAERVWGLQLHRLHAHTRQRWLAQAAAARRQQMAQVVARSGAQQVAAVCSWCSTHWAAGGGLEQAGSTGGRSACHPRRQPAAAAQVVAVGRVLAGTRACCGKRGSRRRGWEAGGSGCKVEALQVAAQLGLVARQVLR